VTFLPVESCGMNRFLDFVKELYTSKGGRLDWLDGDCGKCHAGCCRVVAAMSVVVVKRRNWETSEGLTTLPLSSIKQYVISSILLLTFTENESPLELDPRSTARLSQPTASSDGHPSTCCFCVQIYLSNNKRNLENTTRM